MATTTQYPTADAAVSGTWTTPTNVQADDGAVASVTIAAKNTTNDREQGNFGFDSAIPADSVINSVQLEVEHRVTTTGGIANLENLGYISTTAGAVNSDTAEPTTLTARTYPNYARPGGGSWTRADLLNGTFKTRTRARSGNNATSVTYEWDYIRVTVDYTPPATGDLSITLSALTLTADATVDVQGTADNTLAALTLTADGTQSAGGITGDLSITLAALALSAAGAVDVQGTADNTLSALTLSGAAVVDVQGSAALTLDALTLSSAGVVDVVGDAANTLSALTLSASGGVDVQGTLDTTLTSLTLTADGGSPSVTGDANITLDALSLSAAGIVDVQGTASLTLNILVLSATGAMGATVTGTVLVFASTPFYVDVESRTAHDVAVFDSTPFTLEVFDKDGIL